MRTSVLPIARHRACRPSLRLVTARLGELLVTLVLALALAFAGAARAMPLAHGLDQQTFVICSDGGSKTVTVDREGVPVQPSNACLSCPECLGGSPFAFTLPETARLTAETADAAPFVLKAVARSPILHQRPVSRGPPPVGKNVFAASSANRFGAICGSGRDDGQACLEARP